MKNSESFPKVLYGINDEEQSPGLVEIKLGVDYVESDVLYVSLVGGWFMRDARKFSPRGGFRQSKDEAEKYFIKGRLDDIRTTFLSINRYIEQCSKEIELLQTMILE